MINKYKHVSYKVKLLLTYKAIISVRLHSFQGHFKVDSDI